MMESPGSAEVIATIIKLDTGYILQMYGKSVAIQDAKQLGHAVTRMAKKPPKAPSHTAPKEGIGGEIPGGELLVPEERLNIQRRNIRRLATSHVDGALTEAELVAELARYCPELWAEEVWRTVRQIKDDRETPKPAGSRAEARLGLVKCACVSCPQNVSEPNPHGLCVGCWGGEHLHPTPGNGMPPVTKLDNAWLQQDDDDDEGETEDGALRILGARPEDWEALPVDVTGEAVPGDIP